jgi:hypothetical protein
MFRATSEDAWKGCYGLILLRPGCKTPPLLLHARLNRGTLTIPSHFLRKQQIGVSLTGGTETRSFCASALNPLRLALALAGTAVHFVTVTLSRKRTKAD